jgi:photosystem II stability/assembly factor-like uncharacterized protein
MAILNLVFSSVNPKVVWAGGEKGILWRSGDAGASFEAAGKPGKEAIRTILPDPRRPETLLVLTEGGVFGSASSGESWQKILEGKAALARHPKQPDALLSALDGTIQASADGGRSWRKGGTFEGKPLALTFDRRGGRVYLATDAQLLRSEDDGKTFEKQPKFVSGVVQDPLRERRWYGIESARPRLDDGAGFAKFDRSLEDKPESDGDVLIAGSDFLTFVSRKGVFYRTFCGTDDWSPIERRSETGPGEGVKAVVVDPKNWKRWLASDSAGIWLTEDVAKTWTKIIEAR